MLNWPMSSPHKIKMLGAFCDRALEESRAPAVMARAREVFFSFSGIEISSCGTYKSSVYMNINSILFILALELILGCWLNNVVVLFIEQLGTS